MILLLQWSQLLYFPTTVRCAGQIGIMFLNEVALGKEHHITRDDWTITAPPSGYNCVVAKGRTEPGVYMCSGGRTSAV